MGFLDRFGKKADVEVTLDRDAYLPGEVVTATVVVRVEKELELEEGRAELRFENEYRYRTRDWDDDGDRTETETATDSVVHDVQRFLEPGALGRGHVSEAAVALQVPAEAPPSGEGEITEVRWKVAAVLARHRARDVAAEAPLTVLAPVEAADWTEPAPELDTHGDCDLELRLPDGPRLHAGGRVAGALVVTPGSDLEVQEIRVELVRRENVPRGEGNEADSVEASAVLAEKPELSPAVPRELPFELEVPPGACPTLRTDHSTVRWQLRGVLARRLRSDYNVTREVTVSTAPPAA